MGYHQPGRRKEIDGRTHELVGDGAYRPVCRYCDRPAAPMNICDAWFAGEDLAEINQRRCPRRADRK